MPDEVKRKLADFALQETGLPGPETFVLMDQGPVIDQKSKWTTQMRRLTHGSLSQITVIVPCRRTASANSNKLRQLVRHCDRQSQHRYHQSASLRSQAAVTKSSSECRFRAIPRPPPLKTNVVPQFYGARSSGPDGSNRDLSCQDCSMHLQHLQTC